MQRLLQKMIWILISGLCFFSACQQSQESLPEEGHKEINGTSLYYEVIGSGEPIVFLHGGPGMSHDQFLPHVLPLAEKHQLIFFDQRLSGRSSGHVDSSAVTLQHFIDDIDGIRKAFNIGKMNLLGHSWGAFLAMEYAIRYPDNLKSLLLVNSISASATLAQEANLAVASRFTPEEIEERTKILQSEGFKKGDMAELASLFRVTLRPVFYNRDLVSQLNLAFPEDYRAKSTLLQLLYRDVAEYDLHGQLAAIKCSTLIIHSDTDPTPLTSIELIQNAIPGATLHVIDNCGHFPFLESQDIFSKTVIDFLQQIK